MTKKLLFMKTILSKLSDIFIDLKHPRFFSHVILPFTIRYRLYMSDNCWPFSSDSFRPELFNMFFFAILLDRNQCVKYDGVPTKSGSYDTSAAPPPLKGTGITGGMHVQHL